jgi:hypothetical protein
VLLLTDLLLLFPDGRPPSPRWRPVAWLSAIETEAVELIGGVMVSLLVLCGLASVAALVVRFRRSRGVERQQLKWFVSAGVVTFTGWWVIDQVVVGRVRVPAAGLLTALVVATIPVAAGVAILRYHLYDIDRLINRTLVYGALTALLGAVYAALVLTLGQLFGRLGAQPPSWVVAGATLAVAALFQPARRRIQDLVDRRFNRRKYDAARTIEAFSARLRDELDLDTLAAELVAVTDQTVQPTSASLWLRPSVPVPSRTDR